LCVALNSGINPQRLIFEDFSWYLATILSAPPEATSFYYEGEKKMCPVSLGFKKAFHQFIGEGYKGPFMVKIKRISWDAQSFEFRRKPAA
jgi:hypothetical protein